MRDGQVEPLEDLVEVGGPRLGQPGGDQLEQIPGIQRHRTGVVGAEQQDGRAAQPVRHQRRRRPGPEHDGFPPEPDLDVPLVAGERQVQRSGDRADPAPRAETEEILGDQRVHKIAQDSALGPTPVLVGSAGDVLQRGSHVPILACRALS